MFGKGLITGLGVTLKHFFGKKSTFCYPEEKLPMTEHFRGGHLALEYKKCIACTLCAQACPNQALKLKVVVDANKKRYLSEYIYQMGRCLYCDLCVEACPTKALSWDREYAISTWHKADMTHDVLTDEDRAYLKQAMAEAAANPKPPAAPRPKPASAPEKPAETKPTEAKIAENVVVKPTITETTGKEASGKTANESVAPAKPLIEGAASETEVSAHE